MLKKRITIALILIILIIIFGLSNLFINNESLLINIMVFLALTQGINLLYGFTGYMPFGYVAFFGAGAYGCALTIMFLHISPILAIIIGGVSACIIAIILIPLLRLEGAYFAIATLAAAQALNEIIANPHLTKITQGPYGINLANVYDPSISYWAMLGVLLISVFMVAYLRSSKFGLALMAIRDNKNSATTSGIDIYKFRSIAWLMSAFIGGLVGGAYAWNISFFYPDSVFSITLSLFPVIFAIFGGVGTVIGPLIGAGILYILYNQIGVTNPQYFQLLYGVLIVFLLLFIPGGVTSIFKSKVNMDVF